MTRLKAVLGRDFFARETRTVARELIGQWLCTRVGGRLTAGVIVESEAYLPAGDSASHAARGQRLGNAAMFLRPGVAYVYPIHARCCFNVVTEAEGVGAAVLIRALDPKLGLPLMQQRRATRRAADWTAKDLCSGPAKLCEALGITRQFDQHDLTTGRLLWLSPAVPGEGPSRVRTTPRIGVTSAADLRLRFVWAGHPLASGPQSWR